jgi:hypothetical protein
MRVLPLLLCLALAGCAGGNAISGLSPSASTGSASAGATQAQASNQTGSDAGTQAGADVQASAHASLSPRAGGKNRRAAAAPKSKPADKKSDTKDEWWKEGGVTREKISAMCWMKYEKGRRDLPLEKRADLVNQCVADALKEHPLR